MLKKLLASALAVATVASCAYVPTALASAATTTKVADATEYSIWELTNKPAPEQEVDVTVYVAGSATTSLGRTSYVIEDVKVSQNNEETIQAKLAEATGIKDQDANKLNLKEIVSVSKTANASIYVAQINEKKAVYYSEYNSTASAPATTKADDVKAANVTLLGWYDVNTSATAITADMYATGVTPRIASWTGNEKEFAYWDYAGGNIIVPQFRALTNAAGAYTSVDVYYPANGVAADRILNGSYALISTTPVHDVVSVPNNDKANWLTYVSNFAKANWTGTQVTAADGKTYTFAAIRQVADKKYAAIFTKDSDPTSKASVKYTLKYNGTVIGTAETEKEYNADAVVYTTNVDEVYAIVKSASDKATLAEYLENIEAGKKYVWDGTCSETTVNKKDDSRKVVIDINATEYTKYTVYSYDENSNVVKNDKVYIAASKLTGDFVDVNGNLKKVTAADLGVVVNARVEGVPAVYTSAKVDTSLINTINTTYTLGDETAALTDFATATGAFQSQPYFGRDAKVGDQVTLKVSLSETGAAKKLDLTKLEVAYSVVGATVVKTNYDYVATEYPAGEAIDIALAEGTNIVTATIKYNGKVLGTTEPFYAYVG